MTQYYPDTPSMPQGTAQFLDPVQVAEHLDVKIMNLDDLVKALRNEGYLPRARARSDHASAQSFTINPFDTVPVGILQLDPLRKKAQIFVNAPGPNTGYENGGSVTNPGALTNIASLGVVPPPGNYLVNWTVGLQGTVTAADASNMKLLVGGVTVAVAEYPGQVGNFPMPPIEAVLPQGYTSANGIKVQSQGAASGASAIYTADISATPVGGQAGQQLVAICHSQQQAQNILTGVGNGLYSQGTNIPDEGLVVPVGTRVPYDGQAPLWAVPLGLTTIIGVLAEREDA